MVLRSPPGGTETHWKGCRAGSHVIGIESDGTIKGCPSLPTGPCAGGNVRELDLETIWAESKTVGFTRELSVDDLWGYCKRSLKQSA